jgi:tRNA modification GTPase
MTGEPIDDGIALSFPAPRSYTGEPVLELHIHGGRAVIAALYAALGGIAGLRLAEPGEFTRRAFINGKLDLTEVEGLADLIAAETEGQRQQALRVAAGQLRDLYDGWRTKLIEAMSLIESAIDFSDEGDVARDAIDQATSRVRLLHAKIAQHLNDGRRGEIMRDGFRVVIAGPPNAGKSSLLNALARREVAIVSPEPGTTRDALEVHLDLGGVPVILTDTAGIREKPEGAIEAEGIRRSYARTSDANLVLWLWDGTVPMITPPEQLPRLAPLLEVMSKIDLLPPTRLANMALSVSALTGSGLDQLVAKLSEMAKAHRPIGDGAVITTARQRARITETLTALGDYLAGDFSLAELQAEHLRRAAQSLGRLTGRIYIEDVLDRIFASFCIGK